MGLNEGGRLEGAGSLDAPTGTRCPADANVAWSELMQASAGCQPSYDDLGDPGVHGLKGGWHNLIAPWGAEVLHPSHFAQYACTLQPPGYQHDRLDNHVHKCWSRLAVGSQTAVTTTVQAVPFQGCRSML